MKIQHSLRVVGKDLETHLTELGLDAKSGKVDVMKIENFRSSDEHLFKYEAEVMQAISILSILNKSTADQLLGALRTEYPSLGLSATSKEMQNATQGRIKWILKKIGGGTPTTEFPFKASDSTDDFSSQEADQPNFSRVPVDRSNAPMAAAAPVSNTLLSPDPLALKAHISLSKVLPKFLANSTQEKYAKELGLINPQGEYLWEKKAEFHPIDPKKPGVVDRNKPIAPYLEAEDFLGEQAVKLLTGPAFEEKTLKEDQKTFGCKVDADILSRICGKGAALCPMIERLVTHTLLVTVEGDRQIVRLDGRHYSRAATVPEGGNIAFNAGNERFKFRDDSDRKFCKNDTKKPYNGMGGYLKDEGYDPITNQYVKKEHTLAAVKEYDDRLLSDEERRIKRAGFLTSGYVTFTAKGMGESRVPLDAPIRMFMVNTMGPQFEKYKSPPFEDAKGNGLTCELEATDFIIKPGAQEVAQPLFPEYYPNKVIPSYDTLVKNGQNIASVGHDYDKPFARLNDGGLFNRAAHQVASNNYLNFVMGNINDEFKKESFYLMATLYGGGFFADTGCGNLRPEIVYSMVTSYKELLKDGKIPKGSVIEFPRYGSLDTLPGTLVNELKHYAQQSGVSLVWSPNGDLLDMREKKDLNGNTVKPQEFLKSGRFIGLNAADANSACGNEKKSASVESMIGNNSNLRVVMNWWANSHVFDFISKTFSGKTT